MTLRLDGEEAHEGCVTMDERNNLAVAEIVCSGHLLRGGPVVSVQYWGIS